MVITGLIEFILIISVTYYFSSRPVSDEFLYGYAVSNNRFLDWAEKPSAKKEEDTLP